MFLSKVLWTSFPLCIFPLPGKKVFYLAHYMRRWGVLMFGEENALRWNIHFSFFLSWLNYVCVHCHVEMCCSDERCFRRTFSPLAQNTLRPYYAHIQPYGNIKWRGCTPQWTHWISMSVSSSWLKNWRLDELLLNLGTASLFVSTQSIVVSIAQYQGSQLHMEAKFQNLFQSNSPFLSIFIEKK